MIFNMENDFGIRMDTLQSNYVSRDPHDDVAVDLEVSIFQEFLEDNMPEKKIGHFKVIRIKSCELACSDMPEEDLWDTSYDPITTRFYVDPYTGKWDEDLANYTFSSCLFIIEFVLIPEVRNEGLGLRILQSWLRQQEYDHVAGLLLPTQFDPDFEKPENYIDLQLYQYSQDKEAAKQKLSDHFSQLGFSRWVAHEERPRNKKLRLPEEEILDPDDFDFLTMTNFQKLENFGGTD